MLTDDPDTPGSGNWEINIAYLEERNMLERLRSVPHVDVNYGLGERIQLKYETGWVFADVADSASRSGLDDSVIGLKWRFLDQSEAGLNMSVYPQTYRGELDRIRGQRNRGPWADSVCCRWNSVETLADSGWSARSGMRCCEKGTTNGHLGYSARYLCLSDWSSCPNCISPGRSYPVRAMWC